jgi:hypothetical protein
MPLQRIDLVDPEPVMRFALYGGLFAALVASSPATAQLAQQPQSAAQSTVNDNEFRRLAALAEFFDYESSRLALSQSGRLSVRRYATAVTGHFRFHYARIRSGASVFSDVPALPDEQNAAIRAFTDPRRTGSSGVDGSVDQSGRWTV